jgi:hypothetical protein
MGELQQRSAAERATCICLDGIVSDAVGDQERQGLVGPAR